jgi:hypothetical protein
MIPPYIARLAFMIKEHFDAEEQSLPVWPDWPAYRDGVPVKNKNQRRRR